MLLGLGIALILADERIRFGRLWRLIVIVPVVADWVATGLVFQLIFLPNQGVLAALGHSLGLDFLVRMRWTTSADLAPFAIAIFVIWKQTGLYAIFLFAGLRSIPKDVVEAAQVDGASPLQTLTRIKLPLMKPIIAFVLIFAFLTTLGLFEPILPVDRGRACRRDQDVAALPVRELLHLREQRLRFRGRHLLPGHEPGLRVHGGLGAAITGG